MKKLRVKVAGFTAVVMMMALSGSALAAEVNTSEFGKFTYNLSKSGSTVTASTSIANYTSSTKVITTLEVQENATGNVLFNSSVTKTNNSTASIQATNLTSTKLAAFSAHEARGQNSVVKYLAETF
ncbi:hypothetical protein ACFSTH_13080 [Paenibacillus yanchengensis]|uniref:Uncharacterized protein n=1 Tax=Paenibacillus yanchengensis TaxID=2035833 RepID=A0ABW4YP77_9BACL